MVDKKRLADCVILTGVRPFSEVPDMLSLADVCFNSFYINSITRDIIPIKILQYLAAGKPVVCAPIPDVMKMFPEEVSGIRYCNMMEPVKFADILTGILGDEQYATKLGENALRFVSGNYSIRKQVTELENLLSMVSNQ